MGRRILRDAVAAKFAQAAPAMATPQDEAEKGRRTLQGEAESGLRVFQRQAERMGARLTGSLGVNVPS
jgi:hypothetical protein